MPEQPLRMRYLDATENTPPTSGEAMHVKTLTNSKFHAYYPT
jgi:hypothetical protein